MTKNKKADELYAEELYDYLFNQHGLSYRKIFSNNNEIHKCILKDLELLETDLKFFLRNRNL